MAKYICTHLYVQDFIQVCDRIPLPFIVISVDLLISVTAAGLQVYIPPGAPVDPRLTGQSRQFTPSELHLYTRQPCCGSGSIVSMKIKQV